MHSYFICLLHKRGQAIRAGVAVHVEIYQNLPLVAGEMRVGHERVPGEHNWFVMASSHRRAA
jgi:hypothetical protein